MNKNSFHPIHRRGFFQNKVSGQDFFLSFDDTGVCFSTSQDNIFGRRDSSIFFCHPEGGKNKHKSDRLFQLSGHVACHGDLPSPEKEANLIDWAAAVSRYFFLLLVSFLLLNRISSLGNLKEKNPLVLVIIICWVRNLAIPLL